MAIFGMAPRISPDLLGRAGTALYGSGWQSALARDLGIPLRSVQRWSAGAFRCPAGLAGDLDLICRAEVAADQARLRVREGCPRSARACADLRARLAQVRAVQADLALIRD